MRKLMYRIKKFLRSICEFCYRRASTKMGFGYGGYNACTRCYNKSVWGGNYNEKDIKRQIEKIHINQ